MRRSAVAVLVTIMGLGACVDGDDAASVDGVRVPDGYAVTEVRTGLRGPTQISAGPDGQLLVAQLNGAEGDGTGQVLLLDPDSDAEPIVLFDDLRKPTGVVMVGDEVWVMEERTLSKGPIGGGELEVVLADLAYNGRSEGTLTVTPDGRLLYETSGTLDGVEAAEGSGILWALAPDGQPTAVASGLKNAYGRTYDDAGTLWQTEISAGSYDGREGPDELLMVIPGTDFGWPRCIGDRQPVEQYGGTDEVCATTPRPQALFKPSATPTSVAVAPWDPDTLLVALWNEGRIVAVPRPALEEPVAGDTFLTGIAHPQHLLADDDRLLVTDFQAGRILAITAT